MKIKKMNQNLIIEGIKHFNIEHILECGQCFRYYPLGASKYLIIAFNKLLIIEQHKYQLILHNTTEEDFEKIWKGYFDLEIDYGYIKEQLKNTHTALKDAIEGKWGIRILKQAPWETLISFIISQNKQIPHIKQVIENISEAFGTPIGQWEGKTYYSFPSAEILNGVTEEALRACKTGFRAPYILDASMKVAQGQIDLEALKKESTMTIKEQLLTIKGVGNKIADCVLLYGFGRTEVFPTDVWIKRIVEHLYFENKVKPEEIQRFAKKTFKELSGYAQQYLFYYGRENKIGIKK